MTQKIVECIPNFSEGRRPEVNEAIRTAIESIPAVHILDLHSDADHNRSVITFAGTPQVVLDAAFVAIKTAAELINMEEHEGEHPRIGATDVVPFVPLQGTTMEECVQLARTLGKRVGEELHIPVYLYEKAATRPDRVNLEAIRKGEYEGLKLSIEQDPLRKPDFGPSQLGTAGACVVGARPPLVAFNAYLTTDDVSIANKIARAIRHSSGGFRYIKALGMLVEGRAQVSMNMTDFTRTPIARVIEMIRREAQRYGHGIHHTELVGLIPQEALINVSQWYLQLDQFEPNQILETRLYAARAEETSDEGSFLEALADGTPTPGGGSAAAYAGAMAAALVGMVARLTLNRKKFADVHDRMQEIASRADELRQSLQRAVKLDSEAFDAVMDAFRMPKYTDEEKAARGEAIEQATHQAAAVPLQVAREVVEVVMLAAEAAEIGNPNAATDAGSAGSMAHASLQAAGLNVKINASSVSDREAADAWLQELTHLTDQAADAEGRLAKALMDRVELEM
jgi:glutamate formiminotransferase/formiminotetrahydrofolate cyclodeaminase